MLVVLHDHEAVGLHSLHEAHVANHRAEGAAGVAQGLEAAFSLLVVPGLHELRIDGNANRLRLVFEVWELLV